MTTLPAIVVALAVGGVLAWWSYRDRAALPLARAAAGCRAIGTALLLLLLLNPTLSARLLAVRPLILLDHSVSMLAAGARASSVMALAETSAKPVSDSPCPRRSMVATR